MGIWVRTQDKTAVTYCRTIKVWESGRVVNALGKEYIHLGDYGSKDKGQKVLDLIETHIASGCNGIFQMPE